MIRKAKVRRAKLYFLRDKTSKEIRKKIRTEAPRIITKISKKKLAQPEKAAEENSQ